ncbi:hypothetical protein C0993_003097 [Termitomyces sp. T159_Od127]|nr:hypothetical protein C0993_003097 [Termitomyces sp. T159_Od127]
MHGRDAMSNEQAAVILLQIWNTKKEERRATWEREREEREREAREQRREDSRENSPGRNAEEVTLPLKGGSPAAENLGPKFVSGKLVQERIKYPPASFAMKKLKEREYIELSYFTPEAWAEVVKLESAASLDRFTLTQEDITLSLKPATGKRANSRVIQDENVMTRYQLLRLSPSPGTPTLPKTTPTTASGLDRYLANPRSSPWPSPPITATSHHHSWHLLGHHRCDRHISAGLGYHTTHNRHISTGIGNT